MARKKKSGQGLTPLELEVMQVLWTDGPSTVQVVQTNLSTRLAYTTVQTVLNILHRKGRVRRTMDGRAYTYKAVSQKDAVIGQTLKDLIDRLFAGSPDELVMSLLKGQHIDRARLSELSQMVRSGEDSQHD